MKSPAKPGLKYEQEMMGKGLAPVAGLDEAGRGAWAGPLTAAAVILPLERPGLLDTLKDVKDSKLCTPRQRDQLFDIIQEVAQAFAVGIAGPREVEELNVVGATRLAMRRALEQLNTPPLSLLIDGRRLVLRRVDLPQTSLRGGEHESLSIAAAGILAKVTRDRIMLEMDRQYPEYKFAAHKGYGTAQHREALREFGPCEIHRFTFEPVMRRLDGMDRV
nr:ribonuclease HII [Anaerolineae bacterium]